MPADILQKILATKRQEVAAMRAGGGLAALQRAAHDAPPARNFFTAVTRPGDRPVNLIAEIKKASPSAGVIRQEFDPVALARNYADAHADALSVLTDETYFQGSLEYLRRVRSAVDLPLLRKDFLIDEAQLYQARAAGADAVLLIASALPVGHLSDLMILAAELHMTVLLEVHSPEEVLQMRSMIGFPREGFSVLGINNRDLTTFTADLGTTLRLMELAGEVPIVSESGIKTPADIARLASAGVRAVLVGEAFMRQADVAEAVNDLLGPVDGK
jgi:indole-3-glycerol phosphate synthase